MSERRGERERLADLARLLSSERDPFDTLVRYRGNRELRRRISAATFAALIVLAVTVGLVHAFRPPPPRPARPPVGPTTVHSLRVAWRADLPEAYQDGGVAPVAFTAGTTVFALTQHQLFAFPQSCASKCTPAWTADPITSSSAHFYPYSATVGDSVFVAGDALYAFSLSGCPSDGSTCSPVWVSTIRGDFCCADPVIQDGVLYGTYFNVQTARYYVYAFPTSCSAACQPLWTAETGRTLEGTVISDGRLYVVSSQGLATYPVPCQDPCAPVWTYKTHVAVSVSVDDGAVVLVLARGIAVFDGRACSQKASCASSWKLRLADHVNEALVGDGRVVVLRPNGELSSYSTNCGRGSGPCGREWTVSGIMDLAALDHATVFATTTDDRLGALNADCAAKPCQPLWRWLTPRPGKFHFDAEVNGVVFVDTVGRRMAAFADCPSPQAGFCEPSWTGPLNAQGIPVVSGSTVFVWFDGFYPLHPSLYAFSTQRAGA